MQIATLGAITVAAGDTAVRLTTDTSIVANALVIKGHFSNTGRIHIGTSAAMHRTTLVGVIDSISAGERFTAASYGLNDVYLSDLWLKADTDGEKAIVAYTVR